MYQRRKVPLRLTNVHDLHGDPLDPESHPFMYLHAWLPSSSQPPARHLPRRQLPSPESQSRSSASPTKRQIRHICHNCHHYVGRLGPLGPLQGRHWAPGRRPNQHLALFQPAPSSQPTSSRQPIAGAPAPRVASPPRPRLPALQPSESVGTVISVTSVTIAVAPWSSCSS